MGMRKYAAGLLALALASPAACQIVSDPPKKVIAQDVEFLRGCWIDRNETGGVTTLRLLPPTPEAGVLVGEILVYATTPESHELRDRISLSFARDGSMMNRSSATDPPSRFNPGEYVIQPNIRQAANQPHRRVRWINTEEKSISYEAGGDGNALTLSLNFPMHQTMLRNVEFNGQRDGCD